MAATIFFRAVRTPEITLQDVETVLSEFGCFTAMPDRTGTNPATGEEIFVPGTGKAIYAEGNDNVGNLSLEDGCLLFTGVPESICLLVADRISASLDPWDAS